MVAVVLAVTSIVVALFRHPLDLVASLIGLMLAAPLATLAIWAAGLVRRIAIAAAILAAGPSRSRRHR